MSFDTRTVSHGKKIPQNFGVTLNIELMEYESNMADVGSAALRGEWSENPKLLPRIELGNP